MTKDSSNGSESPEFASGDRLLQLPGLTSRSEPVGWNVGPDPLPAPVRSAAAERGPGQVVVKRALQPTGWKRMWRYAMGLATMLRRGVVVKRYPVHLQLESTDACNLNCTTCSRDVLVDKSTLLDRELWKKVIDELQPANLNVSGIGEPFLHPEILDIIRYAKRNGAAVNCATNLTRIKGRHQEVVASGIDQLKVSIDATDPETYRTIRGEDAWGEIVENIREIVRWREKLGSATPSLRFNFALQRFNYLQVADLVDLAADLGVNGIYYQFLSYVDMEDRKEMLTGDMSREALRAQLAEAGRRAKDKGVQTNLDMWERDFEVFWNAMQPIAHYRPNDKSCYFPWISTWIGADGWIRPCPIMPWTADEGRMGHLGRESFAEVWNNEKYRSLRAALKRGERPTRSCKTCYPQDLYNILSLKSKLLP